MTVAAQPSIVQTPQALGERLQDVLTPLVEQPLLIVLGGLLVILAVLEASQLVRAWRSWQHRRRLRGAQEIVILPPAQVDPHGVNLWWDHVAALLRRSGWRRLLYGPEHLGFELRWIEQELTFVIWVPGTVPFQPIAAAIRAAWPGATTSVRDARPPLTVLTGQGNATDQGTTAAEQASPSVGPPKVRKRGRAGKTTPQQANSQPSEALGNLDGGRLRGLLVRLFDRLVGPGTSEPTTQGGAKREPGSRQESGSPNLRPPQDSPALVAPEGFEVFATGRQVLARMPGWYAFRSRPDHQVDPLRALIEQGSGLGVGHSACVQILVRPASSRRVRHLRAGATNLKTGRGRTGSGILRPLVGGSGALAVRVLLGVLDVFLEILESVLGAFTGSAGGRRSRTGARSAPGATSGVRRVGTNPLQDQDVRPGLEKVRTGLLWEVCIRISVTRTVAQPQGRAHHSPAAQKKRRDKMLAGLHLRSQALVASLGVHDDRNGLRARSLGDAFRVLNDRRMFPFVVMGTPELASVAALPTDIAVPGLDRAQARSMPAPTGLPAGGREVKVLGRSLADGRSVGISVQDGRQHLHVLGSTGVGKSTLMCRMILADINAGRGVVVIDPKGDLALDVLDRIPARAISRVTLIDPDQPGGSAAFNPLQVHRGMDPALQVDNLAAIFASIFSKHWGPRIDDVLRVSCLTLMRRPGARLTLIPALLNNKQVRAPLTAELNDSSGLGGFWQWYDSSPAALRAQVIGPVLARLRSFLLRDFVRFTIGRETSTFDMTQILDGGILIARIPKGQMGEDASKLMGSMLLASVWQAATARAGIPESQRRDATVYTDEAHNVLNLSTSVTDMLAEARAYHLSFVLAHQHLSQLSKEVQLGLSANARNKIFFNCSPEDAGQLARHTTPELDEHDLSHLGPFTAAARLVAGNREMRSFTLTTIPQPEPGKDTRARVRAHVRRTGPSSVPEDLPSEDGDPS